MGQSGFCKKCLTGYHLVTLRDLQVEHGIDDEIMRADLRKRSQWGRANGKVPCVCDDPLFEEIPWHEKLSKSRRSSTDKSLYRCQGQDRQFQVCLNCIEFYNSIAAVPADYFYVVLPRESFGMLRWKCIETMWEYTLKPWKNGLPPFNGCLGHTKAPYALCSACIDGWRAILGESRRSEIFEANIYAVLREPYRGIPWVNHTWSSY